MTPHERAAEALHRNTRHLTDTWATSVRADDRIVSDSALSHSALVDHVPAILDEIGHAISSGTVPSATSGREGRVHVYTRSEQGYRGRDLVRELSLVRLVVLDFIAASAESPLELSIRDFAEVVRRVNLYLDEEMRYAITVYSEGEA